ncbi:uracil-xanthine permease family protein [Bacillus taeanensis]|nr:solute carrier family 23 protein [Bacillus taeanensis]
MQTGKKLVLGFQHVLAMFGATVLVPIITGLSIPVALFTAGVGTILFHLLTNRDVPVFLGSSFAFIGGILTVKELFGIEYATGAIIGAGAVYLIMAAIVKIIGHKKITAIFPPVVIAPIIMVIGLTLAPVAVNMAADNWLISIVTILTVVIVGIFFNGFFKTIPIITGIIVGYIVSIATGNVDFTGVLDANWFAVPNFHAPKFELEAFAIIVPIALVTIIEHIGDITTNGSVVGKNFIDKPGLHRTFLGDGFATMLAGLLGGPANTTYGENTGTLAITKVYDPSILRMAAFITIFLSFIGKFAALISTIPLAVMGGISFILFGMIANIGVKQLVDHRVDLSNTKNAIIFFAPLIIGLSSLAEGNPAVINITENAQLSGLSLAALTAVILHAVLNIKGKQQTKRKANV